MESWLINSYDPLWDVFEESLLAEAVAPAVIDVVARKLDEISRAPLRGQLNWIDGQPVYVVNTEAYSREGVEVPSLVIAYLVDKARRVVLPIYVGRSSAFSAAGAALKDAISSGVARDDNHPTRVLFPSDRTDIPEETLERAVIRALRRAKPGS
jgi:hypothetical protein